MKGTEKVIKLTFRKVKYSAGEKPEWKYNRYLFFRKIYNEDYRKMRDKNRALWIGNRYETSYKL